MKLSDFVASYLESKGIRVIYGYIGGMITHLVDSITSNTQVRFVQTYHEQTAAIAAEGYALESGKFGVAISTSGPGATNMITGIADAYFGSIPVLYITGQVNTYEYKYDKPLRQQGFQETDIVRIVTPITKYAKFIDCAEDIKYELDKALNIALTGRKGPVLLDLPMDIQRAEIDSNKLRGYEIPGLSTNVIKNWDEIEEIIFTAKRPLLLLGAGCNGCDVDLLEQIIYKYQWPVVTSFLGRGIINENYKNYIGMLGAYGHRCANMSISKTDVLIVLGSRLDTRQTGAMIDAFLQTGRIIHVDIDELELDNHRLKNRISVLCSVDDFINKLASSGVTRTIDYSLWNKYLGKLKEKYNQDEEIERFVANKAPYRFMQCMNTIMKEDDTVCVDIGQNQMWAAQTLKLKSKQSFITSGGLAPMGFSMPVAIGCAFANPNKTIYSINGDGGFHMASQSLMLISQYNLPIKVIVMNNHSLGMITQFQHLYFNDKMPATTLYGGYCVPQIEQIAKAYSLKYFKLDEKNITDAALLEAITVSRNCIVEYVIEGLTSVSPKLEFDKPISRPTPLLPVEEYEMYMKIDDRD